MSTGSTRRRQPGIPDDEELRRAVAWSLARAHVEPEWARRFACARLMEAMRPTLEGFADDLRPLVRREEAAREVLGLVTRTLDRAICSVWDTMAAVHPGLEAIEPLISSLEKASRPVDRNLLEAIGRIVEESAEPLRTVFLARALNALTRLTPQLDETELGEAAGAASDYAVLLHALRRPEILAEAGRGDPLTGARLRGLQMRERILQAEGGTWTVDQVAAHLRVTRQAVDKRRRAGRLLAFSTGRRGYAYPAWQFGPDGVLPGFEQALSDLSVRDPWTQAAFFLNPDARLGGATPLAALRQGNIEDVRRAARGYGEHSAA